MRFSFRQTVAAGMVGWTALNTGVVQPAQARESFWVEAAVEQVPFEKYPEYWDIDNELYEGLPIGHTPQKLKDLLAKVELFLAEIKFTKAEELPEYRYIQYLKAYYQIGPFASVKNEECVVTTHTPEEKDELKPVLHGDEYVALTEFYTMMHEVGHCMDFQMKNDSLDDISPRYLKYKQENRAEIFAIYTIAIATAEPRNFGLGDLDYLYGRAEKRQGDLAIRDFSKMSQDQIEKTNDYLLTPSMLCAVADLRENGPPETFEELLNRMEDCLDKTLLSPQQFEHAQAAALDLANVLKDYQLALGGSAQEALDARFQLTLDKARLRSDYPVLGAMGRLTTMDVLMAGTHMASEVDAMSNLNPHKEPDWAEYFLAHFGVVLDDIQPSSLDEDMYR